MHEMSIALAMIDRITEEVEKQGGGAVAVVHLRIGELSGVDAQALRFAYELACEGTDLEGSKLEVERSPLIAYCPACGTTHTPELQRIVCPRCITAPQKILQGRELEVRALEIA